MTTQRRPRGPVRQGNAQAINITTATKDALDETLLTVQAELGARATMDDIVHAALFIAGAGEIAEFIRDERKPPKAKLKKVRG